MSESLKAKVRAYYDKGIAVFVLILLLLSLVYLVWKVGSTRTLQQQTIQEVTSLTPDHEYAAPVDTTPHDRALAVVTDPIQLDSSGWTNRMLFVPESRVTCTACGAPRPASSPICPWSWCGFNHTNKTDIVVIRDPTRDSDGDGMFDEWEQAYGLDPQNPDDATADPDGDTFTNLEEFRADPRTYPNDRSSRPSFFPDHVVVREIVSHTFQMVFSSKTRNIHDEYSFGLNYKSGNETITKFVKLGDTFAGFTIKAFEPKEVEVTGAFTRKVDKSELTLSRGDLDVVLVFEERSTDVDRSAVLAIPRDGKVYDPVRKGDSLGIDGNTCVVTDIDTDRRVVVLTRERDGRAFTISERSQEPPAETRAATGF